MLLAVLLAPCSLAQSDPTDAPPTEAPTEAPAEVPPTPEQLHDELRAVRAALLEAFASRNIDAMLETLHPDVVLTTTTGEVARGRDGVRAYAERMLVGAGASVKEFEFDVKSDELSIFHNGGNTAIAWGPSTDRYTFNDGSAISMETRWSASLVREGGKWQIASVHSSLPAFDNVVLDQLKGWLPLAGGGGLAVGAVGGLLVGFFAGRRRA